MKISNRLTFAAEETDLVLKSNGQIIHRVDCKAGESAEEAAEHYNRQMLQREADYQGTAEGAIQEAKRVMDWTSVFCEMGIALGRLVAASRHMSRSVP